MLIGKKIPNINNRFRKENGPDGMVASAFAHHDSVSLTNIGVLRGGVGAARDSRGCKVPPA